MLEFIASDVADQYGNGYHINLVLDDLVRTIVVPSVEGILFWRWADEPTATPQLLGTATVGKPFVIPFDFQSGREIELFAIAKAATGELSAVDPLNGETIRFLPNLAPDAPNLALAAAATNLLALVNVTLYSTVARFRRIKVSPNSDMSDPTISIQDANIYPNGLLPEQLSLSKTSEASAVHRYLTVEHSSNETVWGTASDILDILYADSGGGGGGGGTETAPTITSAVWDTVDTVDLEWSEASGTGNYTIQSRVRILMSHWSSWTGWSSLTGTEAGSPYADANVTEDPNWEMQVQYRIKRTSHSDAAYSASATVDVP